MAPPSPPSAAASAQSSLGPSSPRGGSKPPQWPDGGPAPRPNPAMRSSRAHRRKTNTAEHARGTARAWGRPTRPTHRLRRHHDHSARGGAAADPQGDTARPLSPKHRRRRRDERRHGARDGANSTQVLGRRACGEGWRAMVSKRGVHFHGFTDRSIFCRPVTKSHVFARSIWGIFPLPPSPDHPSFLKGNS